MFMQIIQKLKDKKFRYILYSIVMFSLFLWEEVLLGMGNGARANWLILFLVAVLGAYITQYPAIGGYKGLAVSMLPLSLALGAYFTFYYFPNFTLAFKIMGLLGMAVLLYLISLVNNIFLVVEDREEVIPLYRVASTWAIILLVIVSIPIFVGIYKSDTTPVFQSLVGGLLSFVYILYFFWTLSFDTKVRKIKFLDILVNALLVFFLVFSTHLAVSFFPTEAFLRALFSASVLLFGLNYIDGYMKNRIYLGLLYTYGIIFVIFLLLILVFRP